MDLKEKVRNLFKREEVIDVDINDIMFTTNFDERTDFDDCKLTRTGNSFNKRKFLERRKVI